MKTKALGRMWLSAVVRLAAWTMILAGMFFSVANHARADTTYYGIVDGGGAGTFGPATSAAGAFNPWIAARIAIAGPLSNGNEAYGRGMGCANLIGITGNGEVDVTANSFASGPFADGTHCINNSATWKIRVCTSGNVPNSSFTACVTDTSCAAGLISGPGMYDMGTSPVDPPTSVCASGCVAIFSGGSVSKRALVGGVYHYYAEGQYNIPSGGSLNACSSGNAIPTAAPGGVPADTCGAGQAKGEVNGKPVCIDQTTGAPVNPNATPTVPTTTTTVTTPAAPPSAPVPTTGDGTTVTVNPNGSTTTTTTTTNPTTGVVTKTETTDQPPKDDYCQKNPTADICKDDKSQFGGVCGAFTCEGDAIQCAIAQEQHNRDCTLFETTTTLSDLGNAAAAGTDSGTTDNPALVGNRETHDFTGAISQATFLSGSCPADISTTIAGRAFTLSFSSLCSMLSIIGALGVAVTMVIAGTIVSGAVRG